MQIIKSCVSLALFSMLCACQQYSATASTSTQPLMLAKADYKQMRSSDYESRLPQHISSGKAIVVDPNVHAWGAYDSSGQLIRAGLASAGGNWCPDIHRRCHTKSGTFYINSLGSASCKSSIYPLPHGGAPMPYCMYFNRNQALHGSPWDHVQEANISHGCVRLHVPDAEWIRFNFATIGTKVIVRPY